MFAKQLQKIENKINLKLKSVLGKGATGIAYNTNDPWKVVKFTIVEQEAFSANKIKQINDENLASVYNVVKIVFNTPKNKLNFLKKIGLPNNMIQDLTEEDNYVDLYVIVVEKLKRSNILISYLNALQNVDGLFRKRDIKNIIKDLKYFYGNDIDIKLAIKLYNIYKRTEKKISGLNFFDFKPDNIGIKNNKLAGFDLLLGKFSFDEEKKKSKIDKFKI